MHFHFFADAYNTRQLKLVWSAYRGVTLQDAFTLPSFDVVLDSKDDLNIQSTHEQWTNQNIIFPGCWQSIYCRKHSANPVHNFTSTEAELSFNPDVFAKLALCIRVLAVFSDSCGKYTGAVGLLHDNVTYTHGNVCRSQVVLEATSMKLFGSEKLYWMLCSV